LISSTNAIAGEIANRVGINDKVARLLSGDLRRRRSTFSSSRSTARWMIKYDVLLTVVGVAWRC